MELESVMAPRPRIFPRAGPEVEEFANLLDESISPHLSSSEKRRRVLELPQKYHESAMRRLAKATPKRRRNEGDVDMDAEDDDVGARSPAEDGTMERLEKEAQTWDLLRRLLPLRYGGQENSRSRSRSRQRGSQHPLKELLQKDLLFQERYAVVQWLQSNATSGPDIDELVQELQQNADRGDIIAHGWLHTRSSIKLRKNVTAWPHLLDRQSPSIMKSHNNSNGAPLVTQLDPDAVTRQGRKLEPQDEYFERAIWVGCFEHLRRGSSSKQIREWCQDRTEMWRAISMTASLLSEDDDEALGDTDPASLALWRRMCFSLARQGGYDDFERAVYGLLSGDIQSVEKVGRSWDDILFANCNALLRTQIDAFMLSKCAPDVASNMTQSFSSFDAVQFHGDPETVEKRLIRQLESHKQIRGEALQPDKALQGAIIAREVGRHLFEQGQAIAEATNANAAQGQLRLPLRGAEGGLMREKYFSPDDPEGLRIVAHVYLLTIILEQVDAEDGRRPAESFQQAWRAGQDLILAEYTQLLARENLQPLIPLYCSVLEPPKQYDVLSNSIILESDGSQRGMLLRLMNQAGINVQAFVKAQALNLYHQCAPHEFRISSMEPFRIIEEGPPTPDKGRPIQTDFFGEDEDAVDPKHEYLVRSLEWLAMVDETWPNVLLIGTKVYKFFLGNMHLNAARLLMRSVPFAKIMQDSGEDGEGDVDRYDDEEYWRELLERSGIVNLNPAEIMGDARNFRELEALVKALDSLETMASYAEIADEIQPSNRDYWKTVGIEIKNTKDNMQPLLQNWLSGAIEAGDEGMQTLRQAYLPEVVLAYVSALHFAGTTLSRDNLLECMELAAVVADGDSSDLAASFLEAGRMRELVEAFAAVSRALAISTAEKRTMGVGNKKLREMGWSRDLWSVKS